MFIVAQTLLFVVIVRMAIAAGYRPTGMAVLYGGAGALVHMLTFTKIPEAAVFGVVSAALGWVVFSLLKRTDGASLLWWPILVAGLLMPFAAMVAAG